MPLKSFTRGKWTRNGNSTLLCYLYFVTEIAASKSLDAKMVAETPLDDMESRFLAGDLKVKPTVIVYSVAMQACFSAGDLEREEVVMK